ncbi:MAG TPA: hypothetical protein VN700_10165 [Vicinamibacterales bacterium]|nr:hypothetical protein [Vicinamibacterales bacterium]
MARLSKAWIAAAIAGLLVLAGEGGVRGRLSASQAQMDGPRRAAELRAKGVELGYNLDHAAALDVFQEAIAADPTHPSAYRLVAATLWISLLFKQGAMTAEDFLGQATSSAAPRPKVADLDGRFKESLNKAIALAEGRLRERGQSDVDAHYQIGAAYGFLATYTATAEGSMMSALGPSRRAYSEHNRVLELDPARKDAGLIVGLYRYGVSTLGLFSRLVANLAGFGGGRERGIRLVEEAAATPSDVQTNARFSLIVIYNREARYADALGVIRQLQQLYPRNRLLWLEEAGTALRAGRALEANAAIEKGLAMCATDSRPRAFGEAARWRYQHGLILVALKQNTEAEAEFRAALTGESLAWVRERVRLELNRLQRRTR